MSYDAYYDQAKKNLHKAVEFDNAKNYGEAIKYYVQGAEFLKICITIAPDRAAHLPKKVNDYGNRVKELQQLERKSRAAETKKPHPVEVRNVETVVTVIDIVDNSIGHSYENIFKNALNDQITAVEIEEPYVEARHQQLNFIGFCEMLVKRAPRLQTILLLTKESANNGQFNNFFQGLRKSLADKKIRLNLELKDIHDREIRFNNGWRVKMGRGLDIYKKAEEHSIGSVDLDLRPCKACQINLYRLK